MEDIRERVRGFLAEFTSPKEEDINRFLGDISSKNPSIDVEDFKKKLLKVIEQRDELGRYEKYLSSLNASSREYKELDGILRVAREGHKSLGDISSVLKKAENFLVTAKPPEAAQVENRGAAKLEETPIEEETEERTDAAPNDDTGEGMEKQSKKSRKKSKKDKTRKQAEERPGHHMEQEKVVAEEPQAPKVQEAAPAVQDVPHPPQETPAEKGPAKEPEKEAQVDKEIPTPPPEEEVPAEKAGVPGVPEEAGAKQDTPQPSGEMEPVAETVAENVAGKVAENVAGKVEEPKAQETGSQDPQEEKPAAEKVPAAEEPKVAGTGGEGSNPQQEEEKTPEAAVPGLKEEAGAKQDIQPPPRGEKVDAGGEEQAEDKEEPVENKEGTAEEEDTEEPENKEEGGEKPDKDKPVKRGKGRRKKKEEAELPSEAGDETAAKALEIKTSLEGADDLLQRLEMDDTRDLLKDQFTPEKQAVFELLEEKMLSDVETRIKKLKEMQSNVLEDRPPQTLLGKIKTFFTKETESIETYDAALHGPLVTFDGMQGFNELDRYWVNEPYAFVVILFDPNNNKYLYYVAEPILSEFEDLFLKEIKDRLKDVLLVEDIKDEGDKDKILVSKVRQLVKDYAIDITPMILEKVLYYTRRDFIKFGKIDPLMHDNRIEDISANGHDIPIYLYHKKYTNIPTNIYYNENELNSYVIRLAQRCGKHISIAEPMIDATMPDGSRIQMTLGTEVTSHGATFTIRKFSEVPITPIDLINWNTFSAEAMAYLWLCIENNKSLIFAGGTASGKTSSLNAVSLFIPAQAKIVTLEDTRELKLPHPNWIPGVTRDSFTADGRGSIDMYELLRAALRQRPEFLLVGEVRGKEALTLFQAMSTGHTTFSTMHADSVASAIHRLENPPISVPRTMIQALNIISIQSQTYVNGKRARRNMKLVEITDIDPTTRNIRTNDIFVWDPLTDKFPRVGESKALNEIMIRRGWSPADLKKELVYRQKILEFMVTNKITDFSAIATIIHDYQATPEKVLTKLNITL